MSLDDHGDITVEALQPLLVQTLQDVVAKVRDRHLQRLSHNALPSTTGSAGKSQKVQVRVGIKGFTSLKRLLKKEDTRPGEEGGIWENERHIDEGNNTEMIEGKVRKSVRVNGDASEE